MESLEEDTVVLEMKAKGKKLLRSFVVIWDMFREAKFNDKLLETSPITDILE